MPDALQQLLHWSTEQTANAQAATNSSSTAVAAKPETNTDNTTSTAAGPVQEKKFDTAILDHIMGKSEAVMMREKLAIAVDQEQDLSERIMAMDDFEMVGRLSLLILRKQDRYPNSLSVLLARRIDRQCPRYAKYGHVAKSLGPAYRQAGSYHQACMLDMRHCHSEQPQGARGCKSAGSSWEISRSLTSGDS